MKAKEKQEAELAKLRERPEFQEMERQQLERALQLSRETSEVRPTPSTPAARFEPPIE